MSKYPLIYKLKDDNNTDYTALSNKPTINSVTLTGALSSSDLGLADTATIGSLTDLTTETQSSIVAATNEINAKFPVSIANGGTGGTTTTDARTNLGVMTGISLYSNSSGSSGTIELSDNIENYQFIEICFYIYIYSAPAYGMARIYNNGANEITTGLTMNIAGTYSGNPRVNAFAGNTAITGNSLTHSSQNRAYITGTNTTLVQTTGDDVPKIYKIIGYKY